jgi:hypothetical protein
MMPFKTGDRVRVRAVPATGSEAGQLGTVIGVERDDTTGVVVHYLVRLDGEPANEIDVPYLAEELGPESAD